ncbi:MAG: FKBP-type peptidyl-prolyl cis-trans isomerase [Bacteroidales bacterium]|nr:FKBP-type peptidyl-prolyl cis-trans isomerase [Bacteroidales bacterium]
MKFYCVNKDGDKPVLGDHVYISFNESIGDSLIYVSDWNDVPGNEIEIYEPTFVGDMMAGLMNMHVGDSASVAFVVDSMCIKTLGMDAVPNYLNPGMPVYIDIRLDSIVKAEVVKARYEEYLSIRKQNDEDMLAMYYSDENNTITNDGLIITGVKGKGRAPRDGEILKINFSFVTLQGDTLLDFFNREPVTVIYGDSYLGEGFTEAMRYVPEGGEGHFVIPSSLAFDSEGLEDYIEPYTSFFLNVKNIDIMTVDEYEEEEKKLKDAEEAENQRRLAEEPANMAKFIKEHDVNVAPSETGVYYLEIKTGTGDKPEEGDMVSVYYNMYNIADKLVDSNYGIEPLSFVYGSGEMVPGIDEAMGKMRVGGKATIIVPSAMGFGDIAVDKDLPANSIVIFDLELVEVLKSR